MPRRSPLPPRSHDGRRSLAAARRRPTAGRLAFLLVLLTLLAAPAAAQGAAAGTPGLVLPRDGATVEHGAIRLRAGGAETSYVEGLGWLSGWTLPAPWVGEDGRVRVAPEVADALGLPRLEGVRTGLDGATTRIVLDVPGAAAEHLEGVRARGTVDVAGGWTLPLPGVLVPDGVLLAREGLVVRAVPADGDGPARAVIEGVDARIDAFPLADPARVVVDLAPIAPAAGDAAEAIAPAPTPAPTPSPEAPRRAAALPEGTSVGPGVVYRTFEAPGAEGPSEVHVVELDPALTELRVVGTSGEGRPVAAWADGGIAAINAGYFDPSTFDAIGLRRIGGTLLSLPSRGRAVVGFGAGGTVVARADARVRIRVDGTLAIDRLLNGDDALSFSRVEGALVGTPRRGVLTLDASGRVKSNTIGPARVPAGGRALVYDPELRPLALLDPGRRVSVSVTLEPAALETSAWAVEAGPLLVQDGRPAFAPEREGFVRGARILDDATQQAALGVRRDGTVLLVVAERMVAEDLVPLFMDLGAEAALRLDSGSSATLFAGGRTVNRLLSRPVESAIVAVPLAEAGLDR